jgi:caa(3)-type oxidase subunit IV
MAEHAYHGPSYRHYLGIFLALATLTAVTVFISYSSLAHGTKEFVAFAIATVKAFLVGLIFMHLKFERRLLVACAVAPIGLALVFILAIAPDVGSAKP